MKNTQFVILGMLLISSVWCNTAELDQESGLPESNQELSDSDSLKDSNSEPADSDSLRTQLCPGCAEAKRVQEESSNAVEIRRARIEFIKQRILSKLGLKVPPRARVSRSVLPDVLAHGEALQGNSEMGSNSDGSNGQDKNGAIDDYYGTTRNVVVFPENGTAFRQCSMPNILPSTCLTFRISPRKLTGSINSAELWLYKTSPRHTNQSLVISEIVHEGSNVRRKRILALESEPPRSGWLKFNLGNAVRRWIKPHLNHSVEISCKGCAGSSVPISTEERHQPFLVITTGSSMSMNRRRRAVDCTNSSSRCCRESFNLSFKEIGWDDWILQPQGYTANYCRGTCTSEVSISRYYHTTVLQRFIQSQSNKNEEPKFSLCCTPSRLSSISLIYIDDNGIIFQKSLPNMVVEACDCA